MTSSQNILIGYRISRIIACMRDAKRLARTTKILNSKMENDFFSIENYCLEILKKLKGNENEH